MHQHANKARQPDPENVEEKRAVGDWVTATIDGQVVSWQNQYAGGPAPTSPTGAAAPAANPATGNQAGNAASPAAPAPTVNLGSGTWGRQAYYNAASGVADGLVFLNNMGGQGSGVFD